MITETHSPPLSCAAHPTGAMGLLGCAICLQTPSRYTAQGPIAQAVPYGAFWEYSSKNRSLKPDVMVHAFNSRTLEAEVVSVHSGLHRETLSQKRPKLKKTNSTKQGWARMLLPPVSSRTQKSEAGNLRV